MNVLNVSKRLARVLILLILTLNLTAQVNIKHFMTLGENALRENNFQEALKNFNVVITYKPDLFEPYFLRGIAKYNLGDYLGAEGDFSRSIEMHPLYSHAYHYRGVTRDQMQNYHSALQDFNKALEIDPFNAGIYVSRGATRIHMKSYISARDDFDQAIKYDVSDATAYLNRAIARNQLKDYEGAIKDCNKAIQLDYFNTGAYLKRGLIRMEVKEYESALEDFQQAIRLDPNDPYSYFTRAMVKLELHDSVGGMADFNKVIEMDPYNALTYYNRALLKADMEDLEGAILDFDRVLMLNPRNVYTLYNRAAARHQLKRYPEAIEDYTKAIELFPDFAGAYINRSAARGSAGDNAGARADYEKAMEIINALHGSGENSDDIFKKYADSSYFHKIIQFEADFSSTRSEEGKIAQMDKSLVPAPLLSCFVVTDEDKFIGLSRSGKRYEKLYDLTLKKKESIPVVFGGEIPSVSDQDAERLLRISDSLIIYDPFSTKSYFFKGMVSSMLRNYRDAYEAYSKVIEMDPLNELAFMNRSLVAYELEMMRYSEGLYSSKVTISLGKADPQILNQEPESPDFNKALHDAQKVVELRPGLGIAYYNRGNIYLGMKEFEKAIKDFLTAYEKDPRLAEAYYNRGLTQIYVSRLQEGCADLSKAGELGIQDAYKAISRFCYK